MFAPKSAALSVDNNSNGFIDPGDVVRYTITVYNQSAVPATGVVLTDSVPANTTYVAGSTTLNSIAVPDGPGGSSPLAAGIPISSSDLTPPLPGPGAGTLSPGQSAVLEFNLQVNAGVPSGTLISNQAIVQTDELPNLPTDGDGNPATGPEPTVVVVGDAQQLTITKTVSVVGGGPVLANSQLEYIVRVTNVASVPAGNVVITDDLDADTPGLLTLVAGTPVLNGSASGVTAVGSLITADYFATYGPSRRARPRSCGSARSSIRAPRTARSSPIPVWSTGTRRPRLRARASRSTVGAVPGVGTLSGKAWHDVNFDDAPAGETPLAGWAVELIRNGSVLSAVVTDANGDYQIGAVPPNDTNGDQYQLRFTAPARA